MTSASVNPTVTIVGAGLSGIACAGALQAAGAGVSVLEKSRSVGGRMALRRVLGRRPVDIGASYFTARDPEFVALVERWCDAGLARPWTDRISTLTADGLAAGKPGPMRYAAPDGLRSLVSALAAELPEPAVRLQTLVGSVESAADGPMVDGTRTEVAVVAVPDPQAQRLLRPGTSAYEAVADRRWEPVLALTSVFDARTWPEFDGAFVNDDETLSFVADDGSRRGDGAPVLVAHSTGPFAERFLTDPAASTPELLAALDRLLGTGPPASAEGSVHVHRWTYARPAESREEPYLWDAQRIGLCGDGWGSPRVETAWLSGHALGRAIVAGS